MIKLHPDLVPYLEPNGLFHPLVYSLFHNDALNEHMNKLYEFKLQKIKEVLKKRDYTAYVFLHERPYRLQAFTDIMQKLKDESYWKLLALVYTDSENLWEYKHVLGTLLGSLRSNSESFMNADERAVLAALPDTITVYRGHTDDNPHGYSYTLDQDTALWFARRFGDSGAVKSIKVSKADILGYKDSRSEKEIVLRRIR